MTGDPAAKLEEMRAALDAAADYRFSPLPSPVDELIGDMLSELQGASAAERRVFAESIQEQDAYALVAYAERMAMLGARRESGELLVLGLVGLGYATPQADPRLELMVLSLLHHSARALGADPRRTFEEAYRYLVDPEAPKLMDNFLQRDPKDQSISAMGFQEIDGPSGVIYWQGTSDSVPEGLL